MLQTTSKMQYDFGNAFVIKPETLIPVQYHETLEPGDTASVILKMKALIQQ